MHDQAMTKVLVKLNTEGVTIRVTTNSFHNMDGPRYL
jgi:hypothetical protein